MYYYRVRTVGATDMSSWSPVVSARTDHARPDAPVLDGDVDGNVHDPPLLGSGGQRDEL